MKDFAKSIVCNTKAEVEVGNAWTAQKQKRFEELQRKRPSEMTKQEWEEFLRLEKEEVQYNQEQVRKLKTGNAYKPNPEVIKILEDLTWKRISADEARKKLEAAIKDKNIADLMVANPRGFIPAGNSKAGNIKQDAKAKKLYDEMMDAKELAEEWARATHTQKKDNLEGGRKAAEEAYKKAKKAYEDYAMNSKVGNFTVAEGVKGNPGPQYADMIKEAKSLISKVQQKINSYEKAQNINWGHVGDIEYYVRLLRQMV